MPEHAESEKSMAADRKIQGVIIPPIREGQTIDAKIDKNMAALVNG
jgi:hypothetical protein